jgi:protocatechuate 3,4-dioxygenase beta subunit
MVSRRSFLGIVSVVLLAWLPALGRPLAAQLEAGDLYGTVIDGSGAPLPQAKITLTSSGQRVVAVSDAKGRVHLGALTPGNYTMRAEHEDFDPLVYESVEILVGRTTTVHVRMAQDGEQGRVVTS